jgi:hypothetical protein
MTQLYCALIIQILSTFINDTYAQTLPDDINYSPYEARFQQIEDAYDDANESYQIAQAETNKQREQNQTTERELQRFIESLRGLPEQLRQLQNEESRLRTDQRRLDLALTDIEKESHREHSQLQRYETNLIQARNVLLPLQDKYERQKKRKLELEAEIAKGELVIKQKKEALALLISRSGTISSDLQASKTKIQRLESQIAEAKIEISRLEQILSSLNLQLAALNSEITTITGEFRRLEKHIKTVEENLAEERSGLNRPEEVKKLLLLLNKAIKEKDEATILLKAKQFSAADKQKELDQSKSLLASNQGLMKSSEQKLKDENIIYASLQREQAGMSTQITRAQADVSNLESQRQADERRLRNFIEEFMQTEQLWTSARREYDQGQRQFDQQRISYESVLNRKLGIERSRNETIAILNRNINEQSALARSISQLESAIAKHSAIREQGRLELNQLVHIEAERLAKLQNVKLQLEQAKADYQVRRQRFDKYLREAELLGESQVGPAATTIGQQRGNVSALGNAKSNGISIGNELGRSQGKFWAEVRAEVIGFQTGHQDGRNRPVDEFRAEQIGREQGINAAQKYLAEILRPKLFAEFLDALIAETPIDSTSKKILIPNSENKIKSRVDLSISETINPITQEEWRASIETLTIFDERISQSHKEHAAVTAKAQQFKNYLSVYTAPESIPYGKPSCDQVYQNIKFFKDRCLLRYQVAFKNQFLAAYESEWKINYALHYEEQLMAESSKTKTSVYHKIYAEVHAVSLQAGLKAGQEESFQSRVQSYYELAYSATLNTQTPILSAQVKEEVWKYVENNPSLGMVSFTLNPNTLMAAVSGKATLSVKNISPVPFKGNLSYKILKTENISLSSLSGTLNRVEGKSQASFSDIPFSISAQARQNQPVSITGEIIFPGDSYRTARVVGFEFKGLVGGNMVPKLQTDYVQSPKVRKLFGYRKHHLKISLSPQQDPALAGYTIKVTPQGEAKNLMKLTHFELNTPPVEVLETSQINFSYTFTKAARGKTLAINIDVFYQGQRVQGEILELRPK